MGRRSSWDPTRNYSNKKKTNTQNDKTKKDRKKNLVPKFAYFAKSSLASYPKPEGMPLYLNDADDVKEMFKAGNILRGRNKKNCEMFWRPGMAISVGAASFKGW